MSGLAMHPLKPRPKASQPWKQKRTITWIGLILTSLVPAAIATLVWLTLELDFIQLLITLFLPLQLAATGLLGWSVARGRGIRDGALIVMTLFFGSAVMVLLVSVLWSVIEAGSQAISPQFFFQNNVYVAPTTSLEYGGVGHSILGTLLIVGLSTVITVPIALATAIYLTETRGKQRSLVRTLVQAMSGLPSIVAGLFVFAMLIATGFTQFAGWAGSLALVPLMLPTVTRVAEETLLLVPADLRLASLALGANSWRTFWQITMPAAKTGLVTAVLLGVARVIGETAPLLVTTFAANSTNLNVFEGPMSTLPTYLYTFIAFGYETSYQRAWGAALTILILVGILFTLARILGRDTRMSKKRAPRMKRSTN